MYASFGQAHYFEFVLENPYNSESVFDIVWENENLRIVDDEREWRHHRKLHNIHQTVEPNFVEIKPDASVQVFLNAKEKVAIPFVYQTFMDDFSFKADKTSRLQDQEPLSKTISVTFQNLKQIPVAVLDLVINSKNFYVDRCLRLFRSENTMVHKVIRFPSGHSSTEGEEKYLKCSHPDVICSMEWVNSFKLA